MVKSFLIIISIQIFLFSSEQIILVVSNDFDSSIANLSTFEDGKRVFKPFEVNIGTNGLGWGLGKTSLKQKELEPQKYEGDKKAPIGIFKLDSIFGYEKNKNFKMKYLHATKELICVDDSNSSSYNQIINLKYEKPKSFEYMRRDDNQYELGVVVAHNSKQLKGRGSCIFLHVEKAKDEPTAGCTSMSLENMKKIVNWLDKSKNPILVQVSKSKLNQIKELYPELELAE
ncbi:L,D-transpeptidase family protein [Candidatus Sulfurimonas marisnigri]|uniref:L,D-transpeptidase family protein n=1 Tax=Candidatus Sulfurimonas marisnigri TaxID=2740405 RepID=A0A7S7LZK2_9BACT|nr:L,D-transpeptidase family protein [Candidatus Sulfurimonas marisnigri]QOY54324.1 L,D-transpeptidase family protein [Candidatus Sulfurimonas marisnigri]